ncbi:MAG: two-component system OmpR family response regulator [Polaribacter sp.]|jgi:two-component system OmpR family response regulator
MTKLLIIDDDIKLAEPLKQYFMKFGMDLASSINPLDGIALLQEEHFELVILDVMLPDIDGFEACRRIRQFSDIPIMMLTGRGEVMDRVVGLELGADDYLPKPFEPRELVARIQNILKRSKHSKHQVQFRFDDLEIDLARKIVMLAGQLIDITSTEFALLSLLIQDQNKVFSRDEIMLSLKGIDADIFSRAIDVLVSRLRHKLQRAELIRTVRGEGYQFVSR